MPREDRARQPLCADIDGNSAACRGPNGRRSHDLSAADVPSCLAAVGSGLVVGLLGGVRVFYAHRARGFHRHRAGGQDAGLAVIGYTTQAHFLMNCGLLKLLQGADVKTVAHPQMLLTEHEMGKLFKVIGFAKSVSFDPLGFSAGDRTHTLMPACAG
jgi:hypothetical protein